MFSKIFCFWFFSGPQWSIIFLCPQTQVTRKLTVSMESSCTYYDAHHSFQVIPTSLLFPSIISVRQVTVIWEDSTTSSEHCKLRQKIQVFSLSFFLNTVHCVGGECGIKASKDATKCPAIQHISFFLVGGLLGCCKSLLASRVPIELCPCIGFSLIGISNTEWGCGSFYYAILIHWIPYLIFFFFLLQMG